ncbi:class I SAM-dependent methyltransferase [Streptomyces sp. NPDC046716]|uniref:class I SAM-dependent methyltransferase n=1 Tax=Streptomyces sp. NPDC046716 TaxID=3157093 RepID=UPI0033CA2164
MTTASASAFDTLERRMWAGRAASYRRSAERLCAHPVPGLLDAAQVAEGSGHLDVGCGTGTVVEAALARGARVTAVDAEPDMVAATRARIPRARVVHAVLPELPFPDGGFDSVTANFVLNHVGDPIAALTEIHRVLRPGGRVAVTLWRNPNAAGQTLLGRAVQAAGATPAAGRPGPRVDFARTADGVAGLLRAAGFGDVAGAEVGWEHRADREEWWAGFAEEGIGTVGALLGALTDARRAAVKEHYDRLAGELVDPDAPDGRLVLPHIAVLVRGGKP